MSTNHPTAAQPIDLDSLMRFNNRSGLMNPEANGLYVRFEQVATLARQQHEPSGNAGEVKYPASDFERAFAHISQQLSDAFAVIEEQRAQLAAAPAAPHAQAEPVDSTKLCVGCNDDKWVRHPAGGVVRCTYCTGKDQVTERSLAGRWKLVRGGDDIQLLRSDGKWCGYSPETKSPGHSLTLEFLSDLLAVPVPQEAEQAAPAAVTATHGPVGLTNRKTADIATRGYNIVGYVLRSEGGAEVCISAESAVRWLPQADYWRLMHEQDGSLFAQPAAPAATDAARDVLADATLVCPQCGVDRLKKPCPNMADECAMVGDAYLLTSFTQSKE